LNKFLPSGTIDFFAREPQDGTVFVARRLDVDLNQLRDSLLNPPHPTRRKNDPKDLSRLSNAKTNLKLNRDSCEKNPYGDSDSDMGDKSNKSSKMRVGKASDKMVLGKTDKTDKTQPTSIRDPVSGSSDDDDFSDDEFSDALQDSIPDTGARSSTDFMPSTIDKGKHVITRKEEAGKGKGPFRIKLSREEVLRRRAIRKEGRRERKAQRKESLEERDKIKLIKLESGMKDETDKFDQDKIGVDKIRETNENDHIQHERKTQSEPSDSLSEMSDLDSAVRCDDTGFMRSEQGSTENSALLGFLAAKKLKAKRRADNFKTKERRKRRRKAKAGQKRETKKALKILGKASSFEVSRREWDWEGQWAKGFLPPSGQDASQASKDEQERNRRAYGEKQKELDTLEGNVEEAKKGNEGVASKGTGGERPERVTDVKARDKLFAFTMTETTSGTSTNKLTNTLLDFDDSEFADRKIRERTPRRKDDGVGSSSIAEKTGSDDKFGQIGIAGKIAASRGASVNEVQPNFANSKKSDNLNHSADQSVDAALFSDEASVSDFQSDSKRVASEKRNPTKKTESNAGISRVESSESNDSIDFLNDEKAARKRLTKLKTQRASLDDQILELEFVLQCYAEERLEEEGGTVEEGLEEVGGKVEEGLEEEGGDESIL
jgi:hypothetical protein